MSHSLILLSFLIVTSIVITTTPNVLATKHHKTLAMTRRAIVVAVALPVASITIMIRLIRTRIRPRRSIQTMITIATTTTRL